MAWGWSAPRSMAAAYTAAAHGLACRLLSANVASAFRKRVLHAHRKPTARCLPERRVTGAMPDRPATTSRVTKAIETILLDGI